MLQVDFYTLNEKWSTLGLACRLLEKAYFSQHDSVVLCDDLAQAQVLDQHLWTYDETQFIPHLIFQQSFRSYTPIVIVPHQSQPKTINQLFPTATTHAEKRLLLNLSQHIPSDYSNVHRLIEIVPQDESLKVIRREHYRFYSALNVKMNIHELSRY